MDELKKIEKVPLQVQVESELLKAFKKECKERGLKYRQTIEFLMKQFLKGNEK